MSTTSGFASSADLGEKTVSFDEIGEGLYAYTAQGDPNSGVIVGDDAVMVIDAQATPAMAGDVIARVRSVTDKPIRYLLLTHYHAVRVLGAPAYGADEIIASDLTRAMIEERGQEDKASEIGRFPRLFRGADTISGLTWPTMTFQSEMSVWLGRREVRLQHLGRAHTMGDVSAWVPDANVVFAGDLVEAGATPYCGDAHLADWPGTLDKLSDFGALAMVPGRGPALTSPEAAREAVEGTRGYVQDLLAVARDCVAAGRTLQQTFTQAREALSPKYGHWVIFDHCLPFNVSRAFDEASGIQHPRIWTDARDREMWAALNG